MRNEYAKNVKNIDSVCLEGQDLLIIKCVGQIRDYPTYSTPWASKFIIQTYALWKDNLRAVFLKEKVLT